MNFGIGHETCRKLIGFVLFFLKEEALHNKNEAIFIFISYGGHP